MPITSATKKCERQLATQHELNDKLERDNAALIAACEKALMFLSNVNTCEPGEVARSLIDALRASGRTVPDVVDIVGAAASAPNDPVRAAAPAMLEMLKVVENYYANLPQFPDRGHNIPANLKEMREIIAQAEGQG